MSLVENLVNQITTNGLGGITKPQGFDPNDDTFEKLLQKAGANAEGLQTNSVVSDFGAPAGMIIEPYGSVEPVQEINSTELYEPIQIKDVDFGKDYFSSVLKDSPEEHAGIFDVAKKHATLAYNVFSKGFVEDVVDLADDVAAMIK